MFSVLFLFGQFRHLLESGKHIVIAAWAVGNQTAGAVLDPLVRIGEIASACIPKGIQRTIAEQTAEITAVRNLVTGKIFAVPVLKKTAGIIHKRTSSSASVNILLSVIISLFPETVNHFSGDSRP